MDNNNDDDNGFCGVRLAIITFLVTPLLALAVIGSSVAWIAALLRKQSSNQEAKGGILDWLRIVVGLGLVYGCVAAVRCFGFYLFFSALAKCSQYRGMATILSTHALMLLLCVGCCFSCQDENENKGEDGARQEEMEVTTTARDDGNDDSCSSSGSA